MIRLLILLLIATTTTTTATTVTTPAATAHALLLVLLLLLLATSTATVLLTGITGSRLLQGTSKFLKRIAIKWQLNYAVTRLLNSSTIRPRHYYAIAIACIEDELKLIQEADNL